MKFGFVEAQIALAARGPRTENGCSLGCSNRLCGSNRTTRLRTWRIELRRLAGSSRILLIDTITSPDPSVRNRLRSAT